MTGLEFVLLAIAGTCFMLALAAVYWLGYAIAGTREACVLVLCEEEEPVEPVRFRPRGVATNRSGHYVPYAVAPDVLCRAVPRIVTVRRTRIGDVDIYLN